MSGDGTNAFNGFGGGPYPYPADTRDYDPEIDGCPVCGSSVMISPFPDDTDVHCAVCEKFFDYAGRPINEEALEQ